MNHPITGAVYPPHYYDAPGQHQPIDREAPHPGNAAAIEHLKQVMAYMRHLHKHMQSVSMDQPDIAAREILIAHIRQEVA